MMDNNILNSLVNQAGTMKQTSSSRRFGPKKDTAQDIDKSFSRLLEEEEAKSEKSTAKSMVDDQPKGEQEKKAAAKKQDARQQEIQKHIQKQMSKKLIKMSPMLNYLYNLMYKNPDALSLLEKSAVGLDKHQELYQRHDVEFKQFNKMLAERGLKLSDLTFNQMAKLAQRNTKSQVSAFLDRIVAEKKAGKQEQTKKKTLVEKGKENMARRIKESELPRPQVQMADLKEAIRSGEAEQKAEAQRAEKRQEVINQVIKNIDVRNLENKTELVMKLNPEYLGELKMNLTYEDGRMTAQFETTSREVRELLREGIEELTTQLKQKGLKLDRSRVALVDKIE